MNDDHDYEDHSLLTKKLTMGSLFDGVGMFVHAASILNIDTLWSSEIDKACEAVTSEHCPSTTQLGNILDINGAQIAPVDIIIRGSPCFPAETLVLSENGYKPIEELVIGEMVHTHKGNWKPVTAMQSKQSDTVIMSGAHYGIEATGNHPFYSATNHKKWNGNGYTRLLSDVGQWTHAEKMEGMRWAIPNQIAQMPIPEIVVSNKGQNIPPPMNCDLMYIIGRWLGDGWVRDNQRSGRPDGQMSSKIFICCSDEKKDVLGDRLEKVFHGISSVSCLKERTVNKFNLSNQPLCKWIVDNFGKYSYGKKLPSWVYGMDLSMREALLDGYIDSDGWRVNSFTTKITTVSKQLAHGTRLLAETLGYTTYIYKSERPKTCKIEGRTVSQRTTYEVVIRKNTRNNAIQENGFHWYNCRSVKPFKENQTVYDITVADDHSFIAEGFVVHNCQDLSVAGARVGLVGERSGLFIEMIRIVREMRKATNGEYPRYMVWENVPGALSSHKGADFNAVIEETARLAQPGVTIPKPKKWRNSGSIVGDGYSIAWRILDAQYWGVPHRRRRIFLVLDFGGECAEEILFKPEGSVWNTATSGKQKKGTSSNTEGGTHGCSKTFTIGGYADYDEVTIGSSLRASGGDIGGGSETLVVEELPAIYDMTHAQDVIREYGQIVPTLQARMGTGGNNVPLVLTESPCYVMATGHTNAEITTDIATTLLGEAHEQPILFRKEGVEYVVRRLTPRETERLMGLPDDWTLVQFNNKMMADTTRYKMVGNGVAVPCALRVLSGIVEQQGKE